MGFFKKLLGGQDQQPTPDPEQVARYKQFDDEWYVAVKRYGIVAGFQSFRFDLKHPQTHQIMEPHAGLAGSFEEWMQIKSPWDRRALFFDLLLNSTKKSLNHWNLANVLVAIRRPDQALQVMQQSTEPATTEKDYAEYCEAYARAWQYLQKPQEALPWAKKAVEANPDNARMQVRLADALYMTGDCDPARKIYTDLMTSIENSEPAMPSGNAIQKMFADFFALETGIVNSPVFAIEIGEQLRDPAQAEIFWQLGEEEFYDSPYFRMHHAYHYLHKNDVAHALAKLIALVQEMPWLREPTINAQMLLDKLDPTGKKIMPELRQQMAETIKENGWTTDGMGTMSFEIKPQSKS